MAEGILQCKADEAGLNWQVESAGTESYHIGKPPHQLSQKVAQQNGIDISHQHCRQFTKEDILQFDRIYVMDSSNYVDVKRICGKLWDEGKVDLLLNELYAGENRSIPDPWYGNEDGYHIVFEMISRACDNIIQKSKVSI